MMLTSILAMLMATQAENGYRPECNRTEIGIEGGTRAALDLYSNGDGQAILILHVIVTRNQANSMKNGGLKFGSSYYGMGDIVEVTGSGNSITMESYISYQSETLEQIASAGRIAFMQPGREVVAITINSSAVRRLQNCARSALGTNVTGPAGMANNRRMLRPMPLNSGARPYSRRDPSDYYPARALDEERGGRASVSFLVAPSGKTSDCRVEQSTGHADLDAATCKFVTDTRYWPETGSKGNFRANRATFTITWKSN